MYIYSMSHFMRYCLLAITFSLVLNCNSTYGQKLYQRYKSEPVTFSNKLKYLFRGKSSFAVGSEINLYSDSTFRYQTCGNIVTGTWRKVNNQFLCTRLTNRYRIDSLNKTWAKPGIGTAPMIFDISENTITQIRDNGVQKSVEILTKY